MKTTNYLNFALLSTIIIILVFIPINCLLHYNGDFRGYYAAAYVIIHGGNPYDYSQTGAILLQMTGRIGNNPFYYPPWFGWLFIPFAILPFQMARAFWMLVNIALWIFGLRLLTSFLEISWNGWRLYLLYIVLTLVFFWTTINMEQAGILLMVLYLLALRALKGGEMVHAGLWLGLSMIKPNVMALPVSALCIWLILKNQWQPAFIAASLNLVLLAVSLMIMPHWYGPLLAPHAFDGLSRSGVGEAFRYTTTLPHLLVMYGLISWQKAEVMFIPILLLGGVVLAFIAWKSPSLLFAIIFTTLVGFAVSPYIQAYDYPILSLLFAFSVMRPMKVIHFLMIGLIFTVPFMGPYSAKSYWIILALTVMLLTTTLGNRLANRFD